MKEITTRQQFADAVTQSLGTTRKLMDSHPDKREVLEEFELQLDIMQRRTSGDQVPTPKERERIAISLQARAHFPPDQLGDRELVQYLTVMRDIHYCYRHWEELS